MLKIRRAGSSCKWIWAIVILLQLTTYTAIKAQSVIAKTDQEKIKLDPNVRTGVLPNGFTYYIRKNRQPKGRLYLYMVNKVGSLQEDDDQLGLAHFMEHMNFKGTVYYPKFDLINYLQKIGVRFGADLNASTSYDATIYQLPIPSDKPDLVKNGIQIMHDWANGALLDSNEINSERGVILEEKRLRNSAGSRMQDQYLPIVLNHSRYTIRSPIGTEEILKNFKPEVLTRFYKDWYRPDLQALIAVGDVNVDSLERVIKIRFADLKNPDKERKRETYPVKFNGENHFITVADKENSGSAIEIITKHAALKIQTKEDEKKAIMQGLFNQMIKDRFAKLSLLPNPAFINAAATISDFTGNINVYDSYVELKPGYPEEGFKALWREDERIKRFGFDLTELKRNKKKYLAEMEMLWRERDKTASAHYVNEYIRLFLNGEASPGIDAEYRLAKILTAQISLQDMSNLAKEMITDENRDIITMTSEKQKAQMPSKAVIKTWIAEVDKEKLKPYFDKNLTVASLRINFAAGTITAEKKISSLGITELTLGNGVKVILKPTNYKNDQIVFNAFGPGGTSLYADADLQSANNAVDLIAGSGAGKFTGPDLNELATSNQIGVTPYMDEVYRGIRGSATPASFETALKLVYLYCTAPRKDTGNFKNYITRYKASVELGSNDPAKTFNDSLIAAFHNYSPRYLSASVETINQINLNKAYAIYKEQFGNANGLTFIFIGNFDVEKIKPLLKTYIASLPSLPQKYGIVDLKIHPVEGRITKKIYKGEQDKASVSLVFSGKYDFNSANNLQLDALAEILEYKLIERLRQVESGVYTPDVTANHNKFPHPDFSVFVNFTCDPKNADKLIAATLDEINKLKSNGPSAADIQKYIAQAIVVHENYLKENYYWFSYLTKTLKTGLDLKDILNYNDSLKNLTQESLKASANDYLSGENLIQFILLPENYKKLP